jgi:hypothetical protein
MNSNISSGRLTAITNPKVEYKEKGKPKVSAKPLSVEDYQKMCEESLKAYCGDYRKA